MRMRKVRWLVSADEGLLVLVLAVSYPSWVVRGAVNVDTELQEITSLSLHRTDVQCKKKKKKRRERDRREASIKFDMQWACRLKQCYKSFSGAFVIIFFEG